MIIDSHIHLFNPNVKGQRDLFLKDPNFSILYSEKSARITDAQELNAAMNEAAIDKAVILGFSWHSAEHCDEQNEYFARVATEYKNKLFLFGSVPLEYYDDKKLIEASVGAIKSSGLYGIGEVAFYRSGLTEDMVQYITYLLESAEKYSLPVNIHVNEPVGHVYPGKYEPSFNLIYDIIKLFPGVKIILSHWGGGIFIYELMSEVQEVFKNVFYDTAASPYLYTVKIYDVFQNTISMEKLLFGTDFPLLTWKRYFDEIEQTMLNNEDKSRLLWKNAQTVLGVEAQ